MSKVHTQQRCPLPAWGSGGWIQFTAAAASAAQGAATAVAAPVAAAEGSAGWIQFTAANRKHSLVLSSTPCWPTSSDSDSAADKLPYLPRRQPQQQPSRAAAHCRVLAAGHSRLCGDVCGQARPQPPQLDHRYKRVCRRYAGQALQGRCAGWLPAATNRQQPRLVTCAGSAGAPGRSAGSRLDPCQRFLLNPSCPGNLLCPVSVLRTDRPAADSPLSVVPCSSQPNHAGPDAIS